MNISNQTLYAGIDNEWTESIPEYLPSEGYLLEIYFKQKTNATIQATITEVDDNYEVKINPGVSGKYTYQAWAVKEDKKTPIESGTIDVLVNLQTAADARTDDERNLDELKAAYARLCKREMSEVTLPGGKVIKYNDRGLIKREIRDLEDKLGLGTSLPRILERY